MDLLIQKKELINLLEKYLHNKSALNELRDFASNIIDYFTEKEMNKHPYQHSENEFWYAIWQIQHLADLEHEKEGITEKEFSEALDFLTGIRKMPQNYMGKRP